MSEVSSSDKFSSMNVRDLKKYLQERGVTVNGYLKPALIVIARAIEKMMLPKDPNFECDDAGKELKNRLIIHDVAVPDPFTLATQNNFIDSPPFGLYDIFNFLIYHSADYDKQGLASYKSYDDYRLFNDGYVESLSTRNFKECGVHIYVGKVYPTMRMKTDEGKNCYDLWFILEGKGPNRGSVLAAFCKCKGGHDGGCKHIAAAMYSLEFLLNTQGNESVTSGKCLWKKKPKASIKPCEVKDINITKCVYGDPGKKRKNEYAWLQEIDHDPREERSRKEKTHDDLVKFTRLMQSKLTSKLKDPCDVPAIFPLLCKLYLPDEKPRAESSPEMQEPAIVKEGFGIMAQKIKQFVKNTGNANPTAFQFLNNLEFSESEVSYVEKATVDQWKSEDWFCHKVGFISASKCKDVFTRQTSLERVRTVEITALAKSLVSKPAVNTVRKLPQEPNNPRDWGLVKEEEARKSYLLVAGKQHHKIQLQHKGFQISKKKHFLGASVDDIRSCKCSPNCGIVVVEYKCPWVHKNSDPKEAFISKQIGGKLDGNSYSLEKSSKYYFQVQMQLFVVGAKVCDFVVWTTKGIHIIAITFDPLFMKSVTSKLETFWMTQVFPLLLENQVNSGCNPGN